MAATSNLSPSTESVLIAAAKAGSTEALGTIVEAHYGWLRAQAVQAYSQGSPLGVEDLAHEGVVALMEAVLAAPEEMTHRLTTYAWKAVHGAMSEAVQGFRPLPVPTTTLARYLDAMAATSTVEAALALATSGEHPMGEETFWAVHWAQASTSSLDSGADETRTLYDTLPEASTGSPEDRVSCTLARGFLDALEGEERAVVEHAMGFATGAPMTDLEVAGVLNLSRATVQRRRVAGIERLQAMG